MACAWLIRKHIDPKAEFLFIPHSQQEFPPDAKPFDIPGVPISHHHGHCSFFAMLGAYDLKDPILHQIGAIVDEADTVQEASLEPAAAGLDLICRGIRRISPDDLVALDRGAMIYDALYTELSAETKI
jgi:hypothetical protein